METTFGRTVETRLLTSYHNLKLKQTNNQYKKYPNSCKANQTCASSILIRKSYKNSMINNNSSMSHNISYNSAGYLSDSDYLSKFDQNLSANFNNNLINQFDHDQNISSFNLRTRRDSISTQRYKSLDRQTIKYINQSELFAPNNISKQNNFAPEELANCYFTPKLVHKYTKNAENLNLTDYLTWKKFNQNPENSILTKKLNHQEESFEFLFRRYGPNEAKIQKNRSLSTPGTPQINSKTLPRNSRCTNELRIDTNRHDMITINQKEIEMHLKQIEYLKQKKIILSQARSSSMSRKVQEEKQNTENVLSTSNLNKSQLEVMSLENALVSMNEILKNLTLSAKKKEEDNNYLKHTTNNITIDKKEEKNDLSPPLSASTSISFSASSSLNENKTNLDSPNLSNISPTSFSSSNYSNTSTEFKTENKNNISSGSFSPSSSTSSTTSCSSKLSYSSKSDKKEPLKCKQETNNESMSFRKRLKKFLSIKSSKRN